MPLESICESLDKTGQHLTIFLILLNSILYGVENMGTLPKWFNSLCLDLVFRDGLSHNKSHRGALLVMCNALFIIGAEYPLSLNLEAIRDASLLKSELLLHNYLNLMNYLTGMLFIVCPGWLESACNKVLPAMGFLNKFEVMPSLLPVRNTSKNSIDNETWRPVNLYHFISIYYHLYSTAMSQGQCVFQRLQRGCHLYIYCKIQYPFDGDYPVQKCRISSTIPYIS